MLSFPIREVENRIVRVLHECDADEFCGIVDYVFGGRL